MTTNNEGMGRRESQWVHDPLRDGIAATWTPTLPDGTPVVQLDLGDRVDFCLTDEQIEQVEQEIRHRREQGGLQ